MARRTVIVLSDKPGKVTIGKGEVFDVQEILVIEDSDARAYLKTLRSIRQRMVSAFEKDDSVDGSLRNWVNTHGPVLDELMEELGHRFRR